VVVGRAVTVYDVVADDAASRLLVGVKTALTVWAPTASDEVEYWARFDDTVTGEPAFCPSIWNWTVPATPVVTVAVKVTEVSKGWGLAGRADSDVAVGVSTTNDFVWFEPV
jgi:hypothetical protein